MSYKTAIILMALLLCQAALADDIGFGTIKGIKVYDRPNNKTTRIYLSDDATMKTVVSCEGMATITHSLHLDGADQKMLSVALSAYMAGKKVRISSSQNNCEADFIAVQETYF